MDRKDIIKFAEIFAKGDVTKVLFPDESYRIKYKKKQYNGTIDEILTKFEKSITPAPSGIYEAGKKIVNRINYLNNLDPSYLPETLIQLSEELQTELKKADHKERDCDWGLPEGECPICDIDPETINTQKDN